MSDNTPQSDPTADNLSFGWNLKGTYAELPAILHRPATAATFPSPTLVCLNQPLAQQMGLDFQQVDPTLLAQWFSGQTYPSGACPLAQAYAGHQFGGFTMLGDGRALLIGEQIAPDGQCWDIQLKGSGPTDFSRRGDGLAALGPMLREYLVSQSMHALGIPTSRSLAVVATGQPVYRQTVLPGAVLTRVAASHLRVGTFQFAAAQQDVELLRALADYAIARHYPECQGAENPYRQFFQSVARRQAALVAQWRLVGFVHGVLNTDNVSIAGQTIDYGPCAFIDHFQHSAVFSSIDHEGRYAYSNQPKITQWNLARFAESLLPLLDADTHAAVAWATDALQEFMLLHQQNWQQGMAAKLGLKGIQDGDESWFQSLLDWMQQNQHDYTTVFDNLSTDADFGRSCYSDPQFHQWADWWEARLSQCQPSLQIAQQSMQQINPVIIPRNHLMEEVLQQAELGNYQPLLQWEQALLQPYDRTLPESYRTPPPAGTCYRTFCGT